MTCGLWAITVVAGVGRSGAPNNVLRPQGIHPRFAESAVTPALAAATFHPENYVRPANNAVLRGFARRNRINEIIQQSSDRKDTMRRLKEELGWEPSPTTFRSYLSGHALHQLPKRPLPRIQAIIGRAETLEAAVELLNAELDWITTTQNLRIYIREHKLESPWRRMTIRKRLEEIQAILARSTSCLDALALLKAELSWDTTRIKLLRALRRYRIKLPWHVSRPLRARNSTVRPVRPTKRLEPERIREILQTSRDRNETMQRFKDEFGWEPSEKTFRHYLWQHGLNLGPSSPIAGWKRQTSA